ncbi:MAG TPA: hypothetical protein PKC43_11080 [Phycisphaerales bacterium]|nr:hypothetical protein [Phycisphaerales bacterium]HMP37976.1 hypothetical protein [Phycisphaerales bacterium]
MRELTTKALHGQGVSPRAIRDVAETMLGGAVEALRDAMPSARESALREVVRGVAEGADAAVDAGRRGAAGAKKQARAVTEALTPLQESMTKAGSAAFDAMMEYSRTLAGSLRDQVSTLVDDARRAASEMRPAVERVANAVGDDPAQLARESLKAASRLASGTASHLMTSVGGILSGLGEGLGEGLHKTGAQSGRSGSRGAPRAKTRGR